MYLSFCILLSCSPLLLLSYFSFCPFYLTLNFSVWSPLPSFLHLNQQTKCSHWNWFWNLSINSRAKECCPPLSILNSGDLAIYCSQNCYNTSTGLTPFCYCPGGPILLCPLALTVTSCLDKMEISSNQFLFHLINAGYLYWLRVVLGTDPTRHNSSR